MIISVSAPLSWCNSNLNFHPDKLLINQWKYVAAKTLQAGSVTCSKGKSQRESKRYTKVDKVRCLTNNRILHMILIRNSEHEHNHKISSLVKIWSGGQWVYVKFGTHACHPEKWHCTINFVAFYCCFLKRTTYRVLFFSLEFYLNFFF